MKATLVGFELHVGRTVSLSEFFDHLRTLKGQQHKFAGHDRMIDIGERGDYHVGLFITIKDQTKFCELRAEEGGFKISVRALDDGTSIVDFNFFAIHKETGRGLYLHYHQSCSANQFGLFCRRRYEDLRDAKKAAEIAALGERPTKRQLRVVSEHYKKVTLKLVVMVRREKLSSLLEEFDRIQAFEFDVQAMTSKEPDYEPIRPFIKRETHRIRFHAKSSQGIVRSWISQMAGSIGLQRGRVEGVDDDGQARAYKLMDNPDSFGEYDYEEIADDSILSFHEFETSPLLDRIFKALKEHQHIFEIPAK